MPSRWIYCQISSSVQLLIGKTRIDSPLALRALYSRHSSGRWLFGSQRRLAERKEKTRSLARLFSSARRAPPTDRKSVVSGKSVSVREALGGRRTIQKKKNNH